MRQITIEQLLQGKVDIGRLKRQKIRRRATHKTPFWVDNLPEEYKQMWITDWKQNKKKGMTAGAFEDYLNSLPEVNCKTRYRAIVYDDYKQRYITPIVTTLSELKRHRSSLLHYLRYNQLIHSPDRQDRIDWKDYIFHPDIVNDLQLSYEDLDTPQPFRNYPHQGDDQDTFQRQFGQRLKHLRR